MAVRLGRIDIKAMAAVLVIIIVTPIILPTTMAMGIDPLHLGVVLLAITLVPQIVTGLPTYFGYIR